MTLKPNGIKDDEIAWLHIQLDLPVTIFNQPLWWMWLVQGWERPHEVTDSSLVPFQLLDHEMLGQNSFLFYSFGELDLLTP